MTPLVIAGLGRLGEPICFLNFRQFQILRADYFVLRSDEQKAKRTSVRRNQSLIAALQLST